MLYAHFIDSETKAQVTKAVSSRSHNSHLLSRQDQQWACLCCAQIPGYRVNHLLMHSIYPPGVYFIHVCECSCRRTHVAGTHVIVCMGVWRPEVSQPWVSFLRSCKLSFLRQEFSLA